MSNYHSSIRHLALLGVFVFGVGGATLALSAPEKKSPCEDEGLIKSVMNLVIQVNKIDANGLAFEFGSIKQLDAKNIKNQKFNKKNLLCQGHLIIKKDGQVADSLDLSYGQIYGGNNEVKVFFDPIRNNLKN